MKSNTHKFLWIFVGLIIFGNAILIWKYHTLLEGSGGSHHHSLETSKNNNNNNNNNLNQKTHLKYPPRISSSDDDKNNNNNNKQQHHHPLSTTSIIDENTDRLNIPQISSDSKSPWGRLMHYHKIFLKSNNEQQQEKEKSTKKNNVEKQFLDNFNDEDFDVADIFIQKIIPIRFWRLDPLVPEAALMTKSDLTRQNNQYLGMLHKVKHQSSVLRFRWPWHLGHAYEKQMNQWVDTEKERNLVFKRLSLKNNNNNNKSPTESPSLLSFYQSLHSGELLSNEMAKEVEGIISSDNKLPLYARRILTSRLRAKKIFDNTGCNIIRVPFINPSEDESCVNYLSNISNWKRLKSLPTRYDARTIKFQVEFNEPELHSVLKVPQRLFPYEAFAEIGAYHADRILGVRRIPPTAYVCIPKTMIRETIKRDGHTVETDPETLQESGVKTYEEWVEKDLLKFSDKSAYNVEDHGDCVGGSVQPYMADVHHLLDSVLAMPYKTHDPNWQQYFNFSLKKESKNFGPFGEHVKSQDLPVRFLRSPYVGTLLHFSELIIFDFIIGNGDRSPNKNFFVVGSCVEDFSVCSEDETAFFADTDRKNDMVSVGADISSNKINSENINNNNNKNNKEGGEKKSIEQAIKVVDWKLDKAAIRRSGAPSFVHLDQGMAFYQTPKANPITKSLKQQTSTNSDKNNDKSGGFCLFRRRIINRILDLLGAEREILGSQNEQQETKKESFVHMLKRIAVDDSNNNGGGKNSEGFSKLMQTRIPPHALHSAVLTRETFASCERRMRKVLLQLSRCLSEHKLEDIIAP